MKGINTPGQALGKESSPPFPSQGTRYFTLRSRHPLGIEIIKMLLILLLRWKINKILT